MNKIDFKKILQKDRRTLSKAITLLESTNSEHKKDAFKLIDQLLPYQGKSKRIAITGVPGVGKSTLIETLGMHLIENNHSVAVLAVDPSSPISGGSLLGDKTRMEKLSVEKNAFIRPSSNSGHLGGVTEKTQALIFLCEAAGFDFIIVETVGVGQSEYQAYDIVDHFMLLTLPNAGDGLQGIKKGILELADSILVNKADTNKNQAELTKAQISEALHYSNKLTPISLVSAISGDGIESLYQSLKNIKVNHHKRKNQEKKWLQYIFKEEFYQHILKSKSFNKLFNSSNTPTFREVQDFLKKINI